MKTAIKAMKAMKVTKVMKLKQIMKSKCISKFTAKARQAAQSGPRSKLLTPKKTQSKTSASSVKRTVKKNIKVKKGKGVVVLTEEAKARRRDENLVGRNFQASLEQIVKFDVEEGKRLGNEFSETLADPEEDARLSAAIDAGMKLFKDAWLAFVMERDIGNADGEDREDRAAAFREKVVVEEYEDLKKAMLDLLPWLGPMLPAKGNESLYQVIEVQGHTPPSHLDEGQATYTLLGAKLARGVPASEKLLGSKLACLRRKPSFRALDAFCAVMATVSGRKEKSFLELFSTLDDLEADLDNQRAPRIKTSPKRHELIREFLEKEASYGFGYFSHYIVHPTSLTRVGFISGSSGLTPASLLIVERVPLFEAIGNENDDEGDAPLCGQAKNWSWIVQPGREFALQDANFGVEDKAENSLYARKRVEELQPEPWIRDLLISKKPVVYLEVVASLAPKDVAKREGHAAIVKAELAYVMREAKSRGEGVVMMMGSNKPHKLAEKVYMREPISDHGLRCGYLRWRASADEPWAREVKWDDRTCLCMQMP